MRLSACLLLAAAVSMAAPARRVLLIGNSAYEHLPHLRSPKANVQALAATLSKMQSQPQTAYDLSQVDLVTTIRNFMSTVQPGDFVMIYFSGYGFQDSASGLNYLLPVGFDPKDHAALSQKALALRGLESRLEERKAGTKMLLLDASRQAPGLPTGLASVVPHASEVVSFAAPTNQVLADPADGGVNSFTASLLAALETPGSTPASVASQLPSMMQTPLEALVFTPSRPESGVRSLPPSLTNPQPGSTAQPTAPRKPGDPALNPKDKLIYVWVPAGTFTMGCSAGDAECAANEKPSHQVKITKGFWMGRTEVTQEAYQALTGKDPSDSKGAKLPVSNVTWDDARNYCQAAAMRLPTEAEWEYAARAGSLAPRYGDLDQIAWHRGNTGGKIHDVAERQPNAWGLYDMLGNVWEWVADWYSDRYEGGDATDPQGPSKGTVHTVRGGSFNVVPRYARASYRDRFEPALLSSIGFRCVGNAAN